MGSRKGMSGATWFTENAAKNMNHSSPMLQKPEGTLEDSWNSNTKDKENNSSKSTTFTEPVKTVKMGKSRREGESILANENLSTEQKQTQALEQRRKFDKSAAKRDKKDKTNTERGLIREDRANKRIDKISRKRGISTEEASDVYTKRREALGDFKRSPRKDKNAENWNKLEQENKDVVEEGLTQSNADKFKETTGTTWSQISSLPNKTDKEKGNGLNKPEIF